MAEEQLSAEVITESGGMNITVRAKAFTKDAEIADVLSVSADAVINTAESLMSAVNFGGKVNFRALYTDSSGNMASMNFTADFSDRILCDNAEPRSEVIVRAEVQRTEAKAGEREIEVAAYINITAHVINTNITQLASIGNNVNSKSKTVTLSTVHRPKKVGFTFTAEQRMSAPIDRLLLASAQATVEKSHSLSGVLSVSGRLFFNVLYIREGEARSQLSDIPFSEEISVPDLADSRELCAEINVGSVKVHMDITEGEDNNTLTLTTGLNVTVLPFSSYEREVVVDAFSTVNECTLTHTPLSNTSYAGKARFSFLNEGQFPLDNIIMAKPLSAAGANAVITNCSLQNGKAVVQGVQCCDLLYLNDQGKVASIRIEIPFSAEQKVEYDFDLTRCSIVITSVSFRRAGNEIEVAFVSEVDVDCFSRFSMNALSEIALGAEKEKNLNGVEVCFVQKGETLWDISKSLLMSEDEIRALNPDIQSPLPETTKILIYRKL